MTDPAQEMSTREVRASLADVINEAATRGRITYITSRGRRIAAVVPIGVAEAAEIDLRHEQPTRRAEPPLPVEHPES